MIQRQYIILLDSKETRVLAYGANFMYKGALGGWVLCERFIGVIQFPFHCNYFHVSLPISLLAVSILAEFAFDSYKTFEWSPG